MSTGHKFAWFGGLLTLLLADQVMAQAPLSRRDRSVPEATETETVDAPEEPKPEAESRPQGLLGDPSRFSRFGGWGGMGGAMGQWGLSKSMLIMMPPVQEELELTDEQKQKLRDWMEQMRTRGEEMGQAMRQEFGDDFRQADVPLARRVMTITRVMGQLGGMLQENEAGINRILEADQRKRLTQVALQMEGISALGKPEVSRALNLSPTQSLRIQELLNQSRSSQLMSWLQQMPAMAQRGRSARNDDPAARQQRRQEATKQFEALRSRSDSIQEQTTIQVLKVLTIRQRKRFDEILGEPFDPGRINAMAGGRPPGRDERATPEPAVPRGVDDR